MKKELYEMLMASAQSDKSKALLTLDLLSNHPAGIGDHSTTDFYNNAEQALKMLVDADDRINTLEKYFQNKKTYFGGNKSKRQING
jgi:hypothetical protein